MNPTKNNTMNPTMTAAKPPVTKNRHKSPLRRPGASLAPIRQKAAAASLQSSAWPCRPAGGPEPAANHGPEAESGKTAKKPLAGGPKANGTAPAPVAWLPDGVKAMYWTIQMTPFSADERKQLGIETSRPQVEPPHDQLCRFQYATAKELMSHLRTLGHSPRSVGKKLALVKLTERGFRVSLGHSYAAAVQMDRTRALIDEFIAIGPAYDAMVAGWERKKLAALTEEAFAEVPDLNPCPFCRQSDLLEVTGWTHMRPDGSEYEGDAVNCHRCDCVVPLGVWQGRTEVKP
jgi:hypothetical protein